MPESKAASPLRGLPDDIKTPYTNEEPDPESNLGTSLEAVSIIDHPAERALCRKFDLRLLPVLAFMYLFNALDKGNLGNAKTDGMEKDLHFQKNQYNIILSVFYVPYVLCALPLVSTPPTYGYVRDVNFDDY